ncbi:MAG: glycosyltransferase family 4 protein [Muribaculaceae bacterium]|nr:glycosyltransferase family 4 protein [Muribaculaceae bacterium]
MKILYILSGTEAKGGATKSFLAMADSVAKKSNEIAVVVPDDHGITPILKSRGWKVLVVPYMFSTLPYISWSPRDIIRFIPRLIMSRLINRKARKIVSGFAEEWRPDIVHENTSVTNLGYHIARRLNIPNVVHIREYGWKDFRRVIPNLKRRLMSPNTYMVAITSDLLNYRGKNIPKSHARVIYNGVINGGSLDFSADKSPYFFYAGRIQPQKGVGDLINAYIKYVETELLSGLKPLGLKLAGGYYSKYADDLKNLISKAGLDDNVEWLGEIDDVQNYYSKAAATIIPSKYEGFGRVMPEAMAAGSLCVVRNSGGLSEQLKNGRKLSGHDIAFSFDTVEDLTHCLSEISRSFYCAREYEVGGRFYNMINDAKKVVKDLYSYEANANGILNYYSDILNYNHNLR